MGCWCQREEIGAKAEYETNQVEAVEQVNGMLYGNQKLETSAVSR